MRKPALVIVLLACLAVTGCGAKPAHTATNPISRQTPEPSEAPSESPSPSPAVTASPTPPPDVPANTPGKPGSIDCSLTATISRAPAAGTGPLGTMKITGTEAVALTFDDGPDPVNTPKILDLLQQCGVKATFCMNGVKVAANPSVVRRIASDGHTFCNHTWRHITPLGSYGPDLIRQDLSDTNNAIRAIVPDARIAYFRAPGGEWTQDYLTVARELGMTPLHWDVDTRDWESSKWGKGQSMVNHIIGIVEGDTKPGSVILSHDYQKPDTTAAYKTLLPWLKARFKLVAL